MSTAIVYISRHGSAEKSAKRLKEKVTGDVTLVNLKRDKIPDLDEFDTVIIGGSIHGGQIQEAVKKFCRRNWDKLMEKRLGLYLCCMKKGEEAQQQFVDAYPETLRQHAEVRGIFGGEFMFEKMNFLEKMIARRIENVKENVSRLNKKVIDHFASDISASPDEESIAPGI